MMRRQSSLWRTIATAALVCGAVTARPCLAQSGQIQVLVDGNPLSFAGVPPQDINDHVLVPMRPVFEALGARVDYTADTQTIHAYSRNSDIVLQIGSTQAYVNDQERDLSVAAQTLNGWTLVPLRFVSEAMGADVQWNDSEQTVFISTHPDYTNYPPPPYQDHQQLDFYGRVIGTDPNNGFVFILSPEGWVNRVHYDHPGEFHSGETLHFQGDYENGIIGASVMQSAPAPAGISWFPVRTPGYPTDYSTYPQPTYHENQHLNFYGRVVDIDTGLGIVVVLGTNGYVNRVHYSHPEQFHPGQTINLQATYTQNNINATVLKPAAPPAGVKWKPVRAPVIIPHPAAPAPRPAPVLPAGGFHKPTAQPHAPGTQPERRTEPVAQPTPEAGKPIAPVQPAKQPERRHEPATRPATEPTKPVERPAVEPTKPTTRPATEPAKPVEPAARPTTEPAKKPTPRREPAARPAPEPVKPTEPARPATEPLKPAEPAKKPPLKPATTAPKPIAAPKPAPPVKPVLTPAKPVEPAKKPAPGTHPTPDTDKDKDKGQAT